jgi:aminoglycoside 3-N-acetyltransferase
MTSDAPQVIPDLQEDLRRLGLSAGELVVLQSSFRRLGRPEVAPADFLRTLLDLLGPDGTLMTPTFTYTYTGLWGVQPFDPQRSPGMLNGILSETLREWPGARRSAHPTHSVAAVGRYADELTRDKQQASALGAGSSYGEANRLGARILLLGVGNDRNPMLHYAESVAGVPYLDIPWRAHAGRTALVLQAGVPVEVPLPEEYPACSLGFGAADAYLEEHGLLWRGRVGAATCLLMHSPHVVTAIAARLRRDPGWLLCNTFGCEPCTLRKRRLRALGRL